MSKFIYALTEEMKEKLISEGYQLLCNKDIGGKSTCIFVDNKNKLNFSKKDKGQYLISDRLTF